MQTKKSLIEENKQLRKELEKANEEIHYLNNRLYRPSNGVDFDLQAKYMLLQAKYKKLLNDITTKETNIIIYNGNAYGIKSITHTKNAEEIDYINLEAILVPKEKGLINNLTDTFKDVAKEFNKLMFGNTND